MSKNIHFFEKETLEQLFGVAIFSFCIFFTPFTASASTIAPSIISGHVTWHATDSPYIVDTLTIPPGSSLTIEPGVVVKLGQSACNCYANISVQGKLTVGARGTSTRATITSINDDMGDDTNGTTTIPRPGDWRQIEVFEGGIIEIFNADVRYGGKATAPFIYFNPDNVRQINNHGTAIIENADIGYGYGTNYRQSWRATSTIMNSRIHDADTGLDIETGTAEITNNTFAATGIAIKSAWNASTLSHANNTGEGLVLITGTPSGAHTLTRDGLPYTLPGWFLIPAGSSLTIDPGVIVKFGYGGFGISVKGTLAIGATSSPEAVIITSMNDDSVGGDSNRNGTTTPPRPGDWGGIVILSGGTARIMNSEIRYGGSYAYDYWGNRMQTPVLKNDRGTLFLSHVSLPHGLRWLVSSLGTTTIADSDLSHGEVGLLVSDGTTTIRHSTIHDNLSYGIQNTASAIVAARGNWWGSASGPRHPLNPQGAGDRVSDRVDFSDWLTKEPNTTPETCVSDCHSSVLFLPGLEASRLYRPDYSGGEDQLWEPTSDADAEDLFLNSDGVAKRDDVYTKDVIDNAYVPLRGNIYKSFLDDLEQWKADEHFIADYAVIPYDWRLSLEEILDKGHNIDGRLYYSGDLAATATPYIIQELRRLAATSRTKKVTIIAHSNGGLLAKALVNALGTSTAAELIDKIVFVAVPQVGTPKAIGAILHGFDQGLLTDTFSFFLSESAARTLAQNMPSAYNLLPSASYFTYVDDPVVTFDDSALLAPWRAKYGAKIHSTERLHAFIADQSRSALPVSDDLIFPISGNDMLLDNAEALHNTTLDNWVPPQGITLTEIAGWGEGTPKTIEYYQGWTTSCSDPQDIYTCTDVPALEYRVREVLDGDGTVVVPSALWTPASTGVKKYWVDLKKYDEFLRGNFGRKHADILEVPSLRTLIHNIIASTSATLQFISTSTPPNPDPETRLRFTLHSPLTLHLYDDSGNHTGLSTTTGFVEENIPDSRYRTYGEFAYVEAPASATLRLVMNGHASGSFTLDIEEKFGDIVLASTAFAGIPSSTSTIATITIPQGGDIANATPLSVDYDGDGATDFSLKLEVGKTRIFDVTPPEATLTFDPVSQMFEIIGDDNLSSTTVQSSATSTTIIDEAGNTIAISFDKLNTEKNEMKLRIRDLQYNGISTGKLPQTALQYEWSVDKEGRVKELEQKATASTSTIEAHYDAKKDVTRIRQKQRDDNGDVKEEVNKILSGLAIVKLMTENGVVRIIY